jgi:hypothetical protein
VIVISHRLSTLGHVDEIAVLSAGRIIECGDYHTLKRKGGAFARLLAEQNRYAAEPIPVTLSDVSLETVPLTYTDKGKLETIRPALAGEGDPEPVPPLRVRHRRRGRVSHGRVRLRFGAPLRDLGLQPRIGLAGAVGTGGLVCLYSAESELSWPSLIAFWVWVLGVSAYGYVVWRTKVPASVVDIRELAGNDKRALPTNGVRPDKPDVRPSDVQAQPEVSATTVLKGWACREPDCGYVEVARSEEELDTRRTQHMQEAHDSETTPAPTKKTGIDPARRVSRQRGRG